MMDYIHLVWDSTKARQNERKHGVFFEEAQTAFYDPSARGIADPDHSQEENRFILLGMSRKLRVLLVCLLSRAGAADSPHLGSAGHSGRAEPVPSFMEGDEAHARRI